MAACAYHHTNLCLILDTALTKRTKVTDYLLKKGFTKTEATFRKESAVVGSDGRPIRKRVDDGGPERYLKAFNLLKDWIENGLDLYKVGKSACCVMMFRGKKKH